MPVSSCDVCNGRAGCLRWMNALRRGLTKVLRGEQQAIDPGGGLSNLAEVEHGQRGLDARDDLDVPVPLRVLVDQGVDELDIGCRVDLAVTSGA